MEYRTTVDETGYGVGASPSAYLSEADDHFNSYAISDDIYMDYPDDCPHQRPYSGQYSPLSTYPYSTSPTAEADFLAFSHAPQSLPMSRTSYNETPMTYGNDVGPLSQNLPAGDLKIPCLYPGCNREPFKRSADLDRHYKHVHMPDAEKEAWDCDYKNCPRKEGSPFYRKDHFRDHLRVYHNEDLGKRGKGGKSKGVAKKGNQSTWWRCTRCLGRVSFAKHGENCPSCMTNIGKSR